MKCKAACRLGRKEVLPMIVYTKIPLHFMSGRARIAIKRC